MASVANRPSPGPSEGWAAAAPASPGALQMQFLGINLVQLDWTDSSNSELGYVVRKTVNGGVPQIIAEVHPKLETVPNEGVRTAAGSMRRRIAPSRRWRSRTGYVGRAAARTIQVLSAQRTRDR